MGVLQSSSVSISRQYPDSTVSVSRQYPDLSMTSNTAPDRSNRCMSTVDEAPLWTMAHFMSTVPDHLKNDLDVLNMAEQFRLENLRYEKVLTEVKEKEAQLRKILEIRLYGKHS